MATVRKPFQGVLNIVRFNWHFYMLALLFVLVLGIVARLAPAWQMVLQTGALLALATTLLSLVVSYYVYDFSGLYRFAWLRLLPVRDNATIVNINAGFDETSAILQDYYLSSRLLVYDFYDPRQHTEVSIERARKAYPAYPGTQPINTSHLPLNDGSADVIFLILAAHEIRDDAERALFFASLRRVVTPTGTIVVVEHLRNAPNFFAYTIGFFHFYSRNTWLKTFSHAGLKVVNEFKITPFITTFILQKHGTSS